jgi:phenylacetate-CoA ligase
VSVALLAGPTIHYNPRREQPLRVSLLAVGSGASMSFFSIRPLPGHHWPSLPDHSLSQVWSAYRSLDDTQWLGAAELEQHQLIQFRALLDHCQQHVPYYRDLLVSHDINCASIQSMNELRRIPLLSRRTWQEHFDRFCAEQLPSGTVAVDEDKTSGTSGVPVRVFKTNMFYVWWLAFYLRDLEWSGLRPSGTMASIRATLKTGAELESLMQGQRVPCWNPILEPLLETGPLHGMDIRQDPRRQLDWLAEVNPDYLLSHTSNLELLASMLLDEPRRFPRLSAIQAISETLTDEAQTKIEAAFRAPVKNLYSCAEAGYLASRCPAGPGLHVHAENAILEILDDADQPCKAGETGRVVLTVLHNFRTPFIRYEIGDVATLAPEPCRCGRGLPLLTRVHGKVRPHFKLACGLRKHSSDLIHAITEVGGHHQHQVIQKTLDQIVVRIVPNSEWTAGHNQRLIYAVQTFFEAPVRVQLELEQRLELSPGAKLQSMVCEA